MKEFAAVYDEDDDVAFVIVRPKLMSPVLKNDATWKVFTRIDSEDNAIKIADALNKAEPFN